MQVSHPNPHGVLPSGHRETVALRGRAHATIKIALCEDGQYRYGLDMMYSHGGFSSPICIDADSFDSLAAARTAATEAMLRHLPQPFASEPASVHRELRDIAEQVERCLLQPSLL